VTTTDDPLIHWGRCRTGKRAFWTTRHLVEPFSDSNITEYGWADTLDEAARQGHLAALRLADGHCGNIHVSHGIARNQLKAINAAKRKTKPLSDSTDSSPITYLYGTAEREDARGHLVTELRSFRITKRTRQRIYYVRRQHPDGSVDLGYVNRQELEAEGHVHNYAAGGWWAADFHLYAEPPEVDQRNSVAPAPDLKALKQAMADAHPDRGGSSESFIEARERYLRARARTKTKTT
jgi:hypothetical protein